MVGVYLAYSHRYHNYDRAIETFVALVDSTKTILEVGVGTGAFTQLLLNRGYHVSGIDRSPQMLQEAPSVVQEITRQSDFHDYENETSFDIVVSHSGGFTFKQNRFESYYQSLDNVVSAIRKAHALLGREGRFLINKGEHDPETDLGDGARLIVTMCEQPESREFHYRITLPGKELKKTQRRTALIPARLQEVSEPYFQWDFSEEGWVVGYKK